MVGKVKTVSVKREGKRWSVVLTAEQPQPQPQPEPLPATGSVVGIDMGVAPFLTTSGGEHIANPRHGRKAAAKAGPNRSMADAGWGVFLTILTGKAESAGRKVIAVDPRNTSRTCPECGHVAKENRSTQEKFHRVACGHQAHADVVGASNVLRAGPARREAQPAQREAPTFRWGRSHGRVPLWTIPGVPQDPADPCRYLSVSPRSQGSGAHERTASGGCFMRCLATKRISHPRSAMNCHPLRRLAAAPVDASAR